MDPQPGEPHCFLVATSPLTQHASDRAAMATFPSPPASKNTYVHLEPNKQVADLSAVLLERELSLSSQAVAPTSLLISSPLDSANTPGPVQNWDHQHFRSFVKYSEARPDVGAFMPCRAHAQCGCPDLVSSPLPVYPDSQVYRSLGLPAVDRPIGFRPSTNAPPDVGLQRRSHR